MVSVFTVFDFFITCDASYILEKCHETTYKLSAGQFIQFLNFKFVLCLIMRNIFERVKQCTIVAIYDNCQQDSLLYLF